MVLAGTYALVQTDESIKDFSQSIRNENLDIPMYFGTLYGEPYTPLIIGTGLIISGNSGNEKNKRIGFEILQTTLYSATLTQLIKVSLGRSRPYNNEGALNFTFFNISSDGFWSMPSGHTDVAFSTSSVLALNTDNTWMKILYFTPAFITGISRIYHNKHWASDVFLGAAIGYFTAKFVHNLHNENSFQKDLVIPNSNIFKFSIPL